MEILLGGHSAIDSMTQGASLKLRLSPGDRPGEVKAELLITGGVGRQGGGSSPLTDVFSLLPIKAAELAALLGQ